MAVSPTYPNGTDDVTMINSQQFNHYLQSNPEKPLDSTYLFCGNEPFFSEESVQQLIAVAKQKGFSQREIFYLDHRAKCQPIFEALQSPGLFDPKKIIEIRFETNKPTTKLGQQLLKVSSHNTENLLIIQGGIWINKIRKEKWFITLSQSITSVIAEPIRSNQFPNWIFQRAKQLGVQLQSDALKTILQYSEGNLLWTNQILTQLSHSGYQQPIAMAVIEQMLSDLSIFQVNDLTHALLTKNTNALRIAQKLAHENESLVLIAAVLFREFNTIDQLTHSGKPFAAACRALGIWQSKQSQYQNAIKHYNTQQIQQAITQLAQLDRINKGIDKGDAWLTLNQLIGDLLLQ